MALHGLMWVGLLRLAIALHHLLVLVRLVIGSSGGLMGLLTVIDLPWILCLSVLLTVRVGILGGLPRHSCLAKCRCWLSMLRVLLEVCLLLGTGVVEGVRPFIR